MTQDTQPSHDYWMRALEGATKAGTVTAIALPAIGAFSRWASFSLGHIPPGLAVQASIPELAFAGFQTFLPVFFIVVAVLIVMPLRPWVASRTAGTGDVGATECQRRSLGRGRTCAVPLAIPGRTSDGCRPDAWDRPRAPRHEGRTYPAVWALPRRDRARRLACRVVPPQPGLAGCRPLPVCPVCREGGVRATWSRIGMAVMSARPA